MLVNRVGGGIEKQEKTITAGTSAVTVTADTGKAFSKVTVNPTPSQSKTASPSTSSQTITPDSGKLLSSVTVNAMPTTTQATPSIEVSNSGLITASATQTTGYVSSGTKSATKQLTTQGAKTVTPSTSTQTAVESGVYTTGAVTVAAVPTETKSTTAGTSAQDVTPSSGKFLTKVTVNPTPSQGKTATPSTTKQTIYPDSGKLLSSVVVNAMPSGAMSDISVSSSGLITSQIGTSGYLASGTNKTKQLTTKGATTITPTTSEQTAVAAGVYTTGAIKVAAVEDVTTEVNAQPPIVEDIIESLVGKATGANATAANIQKGYSAYVGQTLVNGTMLASDTISGTKTFSSGTKTFTVNHGFGTVPSYAAIYMLGSTSSNSYFQRIITDNWNATNTQTNTSGGLITKTSTSVTFNVYNSSSFSFASDATYLWVIKK